MRILKKCVFFIEFLRFSLIYPFINIKDLKLIKDIERWEKIKNLNNSRYYNLIFLMSKYKEFRNIVIYRNQHRIISRTIIKLFYPPLQTLYIEAKSIGGGLFIQHGFSTIIAAEEIGENFWVNQQVTIGYKDNTRAPIIGDNVTVTSGAKVLGAIEIANNVIIGANAVVVDNISDNVVVGGIPAKIIKTKD